MKFKKLSSGKEVNVNTSKYFIEWNKKVSSPQKMVKDALYPFWQSHSVLEEFLIPGSLLRIDILNTTLRLAIEVSPSSTHTKKNKFFHKSDEAFLSMIDNDAKKRVWIKDNNFILIELMDEELKEIKEGKIKKLFLDKYGIVL